MAKQNYRQLILEGIEGLSSDSLAEITCFIYMLRRRAQRAKCIGETLQERAVGESFQAVPVGQEPLTRHENEEEYKSHR